MNSFLKLSTPLTCFVPGRTVSTAVAYPCGGCLCGSFYDYGHYLLFFKKNPSYTRLYLYK